MRKNGPNPSISVLCMKNRGLLINVPPFGGIRETFRNHKFGSKVKGELWRKGLCEVRKLFLEKEITFVDIKSTSILHMRNKIDETSSKIIDKNNTKPDQLLLKKVVCDKPTNYDALHYTDAQSN